MGRIRDEVVASGHLTQFPNERPLIVPFLANFDVTWARRRSAYNTQLSIYFLSPDTNARQQFGFTAEVLLAISDYADIQPRTLQALESFMQDEPGKGRVDPTVYFIMTPDQNGLNWLQQHSSIHYQATIGVVFVKKDLISHGEDPWLIRNVIASQMFSRDLFNEQLPLRSDLYFFGRDRIVADFLNAAKQSQNRGIFGLRRTGKTSVLYKVRRLGARDGVNILYYDCKLPSIRQLRWHEFLERIINDLNGSLSKGKQVPRNGLAISEWFGAVVKKAGGPSPICLIFDEIEWISLQAKIDPHWHTDFLPFWQTMWATQSEIRRLCFIISGVNPSMTEMSIVSDVQNPMFGLIYPHYLTGLADPEVKNLLQQIGTRMGLIFEDEAKDYISRQYGGHPLLTRMACSQVHNHFISKGDIRPIRVSRVFLEQTENERERDISFFCHHVISELQLFYYDEYQMLEMLASGNLADFLDLAYGGNLIQHLLSYGLIDDTPSKPTIRIPAVARFINLERARRERTVAQIHLVPLVDRTIWLQTRITRVTSDLRQMERIAATHNKPTLYGTNGFPESERFHTSKVCRTQEDFDIFINVCNRCLVEPIKNYGASIGDNAYFWSIVKNDYPDLQAALNRVALYRNHHLHLHLYPRVEEAVAKLIADDFMGQDPRRYPEPFFALQQVVLDGLYSGIQLEMDSLT